MKITLKAILFFILSILSIISVYFSLSGTKEFFHSLTPVQFMALFLGDVLALFILIAFSIGILEEEIKWEYEINNPFQAIVEKREKRKLRKKAIEDIYEQIRLAKTDEEVDLLNKKLEILLN
jgi:predicted membrane protein